MSEEGRKEGRIPPRPPKTHPTRAATMVTVNVAINKYMDILFQFVERRPSGNLGGKNRIHVFSHTISLKFFCVSEIIQVVNPFRDQSVCILIPLSEFPAFPEFGRLVNSERWFEIVSGPDCWIC